MKKFAIALAAFVSLGLAVPAFAEEKKDDAGREDGRPSPPSPPSPSPPSHDETRTETVIASSLD